MKAVVQRVSKAAVEVEGRTVGAIGRGFLVLVGVEEGDNDADAGYLAGKIANLRIFNDDRGKMNLSLGDVAGEVLVVSQFTLSADTRRGNRPSFTKAASPEEGERLYEVFVTDLRGLGVKVATGVFGAKMAVSLLNDGPVTIIIDSTDRQRPRH